MRKLPVYSVGEDEKKHEVGTATVVNEHQGELTLSIAFSDPYFERLMKLGTTAGFYIDSNTKPEVEHYKEIENDG